MTQGIKRRKYKVDIAPSARSKVKDTLNLYLHITRTPQWTGPSELFDNSNRPSSQTTWWSKIWSGWGRSSARHNVSGKKSKTL